MKQTMAIVLIGLSCLSIAQPSIGQQSDQATRRDKGCIKVENRSNGQNNSIALSNSNAQKLAQVRKLGVTVVYPGSVPSRFHLDSVKISDDGDKQHPDYQLQFCDKRHLCFTIESAYSGIGDGPDGDKTLKGKSKFFGPFTISVFKPMSDGNATKDIYYLSCWMMDSKRAAAEKKKHDLPMEGRYYHFLGNGVTDQEAVAIVESLAPRK